MLTRTYQQTITICAALKDADIRTAVDDRVALDNRNAPGAALAQSPGHFRFVTWIPDGEVLGVLPQRLDVQCDRHLVTDEESAGFENIIPGQPELRPIDRAFSREA